MSTCQTLLNPCICSFHTKHVFFITETNCQEDIKHSSTEINWQGNNFLRVDFFTISFF